MRSIYTLVSHAISDLPYLKPAVALVLGFVGGKMFAEFFHYEIGVGTSLTVVSDDVFSRGLNLDVYFPSVACSLLSSGVSLAPSRSLPICVASRFQAC